MEISHHPLAMTYEFVIKFSQYTKKDFKWNQGRDLLSLSNLSWRFKFCNFINDFLLSSYWYGTYDKRKALTVNENF